jgi:hypothetical protein
MNAIFSKNLSITRRAILTAILCISILSVSSDAHAICGLDDAVREQLLSVEDPQAVRSLSMKVHLYGTCAACHLARYGGPRNEFGSAVNMLLTRRDREDPARQREVGRRMKDILANPSMPNSPTFGELFQQGRFPASSLVNREPPLPEAEPVASESVTVEQAKQMVEDIEAESFFGILQLSRANEISLEVAETLAKFRGDTLILGIGSLSPEVAMALASSRAANVWLHSITKVESEAAEVIAKLRGHLILTGLTELDCVPLAEKLAARPGALSFPYLRTITPEVAAALAKNNESLTLAGLTEVSSEAQEKLAKTIGSLSLPNLVSLQSISLAKKLASTSVLLPSIKELTVQQLEPMIGVKGQDSFWGAVYLPIDIITPEIAQALAATSRSINLWLVGSQPLDDESLRTLLKSRCRITLIDLEELSESQISILSEELADTAYRQGVLGLAALSLPSIKKLDSAILAKTLAKTTGFNFYSVTSISPEAAAALGNLPEQEFRGPDGRLELRPSGELNFPSLEELSPEIASLLLKKRWLSISFPSLREVLPESVRLMAQKSFRLNLGVPILYPEYADAVADIPTDMNMGGGYILFPSVTDIPLDSARILVASLNRGVETLGNGNVRISKSPKLYFGGDFGFPAGGFKTLSPELATELAKYEGILAIQGLRELPDESAAALASFPGPYLILSGAAAEKLSPAAAASLAEIPGVLQIQLRELDSITLAERFARQLNWTLSKLESISKEAAPALSQYQPFFEVRGLRVLDSLDIARRLVEGTTGGNSITLPALSELSPEAARILTSGDKPLHLGLTVIDSAEVARALAQSRSKVSLPRLRAATAKAIEILKLGEQNLYVLPEEARD